MHTTALSDGATPSASSKAVSSNGRTREFHSLNASSILAIVTKIAGSSLWRLRRMKTTAVLQMT